MSIAAHTRNVADACLYSDRRLSETAIALYSLIPDVSATNVKSPDHDRFVNMPWSVLIYSPFWAIHSLDRGEKMQPSFNRELLPGTLYLLILRTLSHGPLHGYAIAKRIKDASSDGLQIEEGSLYPALNRMLVKGWLASQWGISENKRKARFYRLTAEGLKQLEQEAGEFDRLVRAIQLVMRTV